jgi:hypothetical protein
MSAERDTMPPAEAKARNMLKGRSTYQLVLDWEEIDKQPPLPEVVIVRSFIMDELESRNPAAFECWLESNEASPRKFFVA